MHILGKMITVDDHLLQEEVMAGLQEHGRHHANGRLWPRLNGKVTVNQFLTALRNIGNDELADKIEGLLLLLVIIIMTIIIIIDLYSNVRT